MSIQPAEYLVKSRDGNLYTYWRSDILLADIAANGEDMVELYRKRNLGFRVIYEPITKADVTPGAVPHDRR